MELHRIGEGQLRISLSADDMDYYQLNSETMDYDDTATRSAFWRILDRAKKQTGFDAARDRVLIQVFPRKSGGCEMYVTKAAPSKQEEQNPIKNDPAVSVSPTQVTAGEQTKTQRRVRHKQRIPPTQQNIKRHDELPCWSSAPTPSTILNRCCCVVHCYAVHTTEKVRRGMSR